MVPIKFIGVSPQDSRVLNWAHSDDPNQVISFPFETRFDYEFGYSELQNMAIYALALGRDPELNVDGINSINYLCLLVTRANGGDLNGNEAYRRMGTIWLNELRMQDRAICFIDKSQYKDITLFKTRWWQGKSFKKQGGSSKTDRQSRVVVYPNYGIDGDADSPGVLIATYTWNQDAFRFGALVDPKDWGGNHEVDSASLHPERSCSASEEFLLNQIYDDLAEIHGQSAGWYREQTLDYYAYDWYHNRYTMGGYAFFGPGQFSDLYLEITKPAADGYLHFGGEAASCHHAWVAGALDSAWRCVWEILAKDGTQEQKQEFQTKYGAKKEFDNAETATLQYYRGVYANSLEKPGGNKGTFHYP
ncbi:hypothetical protein GALMADRAFT_143590 [Galerina marginata CBS 339.88]|uniref:Amine oxidase domain-containing protein n=1 Tax=Galerina marginata (strain CBS 339.88) TaxID=685588 RepID=A0A067SLM9_GALM3|nr:hypothetical protein GALMADRAFT_143590 [Galerina marginata CBS 339.88]